MRRIFLPDEEAPARCSFADCNAPLDRRMPNARSVDIDVDASYLNALVECASLYAAVAIHYIFFQINKAIPTPIGLSEPSRSARLKCLRFRQLKMHIAFLPLSTICHVLPHSG